MNKDKFINNLIHEYNFEGEYLQMIKEYMEHSYDEKIQKNIPEETIEKYFLISLSVLEQIKNKTKIKWINKPLMRSEVVQLKFVLKEKLNYGVLLISNLINEINSKIENGYTFYFYTIIDLLSVVPTFDDVNYTLTIIGRFKYEK
jgi:hypothetical protein